MESRSCLVSLLDYTNSIRRSKLMSSYPIFIYMIGHVPSTTTSLLTPYFDKNIKEFRGPIPLSIFDLNWQALADNYHAEKKVKTDDVKHNNYTGYPYPDDLTLDYGTWCINYRNFLRTFANPYGWHRSVALI